jgi:hypothetical protein
MPASSATWRAVAALSPVSITGVTPMASSSATAARDELRILSATAKTASATPFDVSRLTEWPAASKAARWLSGGASVLVSSR